MEGPPFGAFPWSAPGGTGQGSTDEIGDGMLGGVSGSMNLVLPSPAAQPPASPGGLVWNAPGGATERGEFAQGFLWFDAQPDYGGWPVKADSASAPLGGMLPPLPLPESFQQQQQQQQAFVPLDVLGQDTQQQQQQQLPITAGQPAAANGSRRGRGSGGGGRQAGGASRGAVSEEERRARNRATQARFRERQKAKNEAALVEHAAAEAELERARQRQAMLRTHNSVLQNMLDAKDSMLGSLAAAAGPEAAAGVAALQPQPQQRLQLAAAEHAAGAQPPGQQQPQQQRHEHRQPATDESNPPRPDGQAAAGGAAAAPATSAAGESSRHMGTDGEAGSGGGSGGGGQAGTAGGRPGGLSSSIQAHMEWLGRELTAQLAMLELPATADPDEAMALAHAQLAPMMEEAMPPRLKAHELLELQEHLANHQAAANAPANAAAASSGSGTPAAPLQQQASTASTASGSAGGGDGGGPCASSLGASSERSGSGSQPVNLAELFRDKPDLVQHVMSMTADELLEEWVNLARAFRSLLASYDAHCSAGDLEKILDIFRSWGGTLSLTLRLKPDNAQVLFATAGNAPPGTWEVAAGVLKPTPAQATMLRQLWHAYAGRAQTLRAERTAALQAVQTAAQQATACCGMGEAGTMAVASLPAVTLSGMTSQYLSLFDAAGKLSSLRDAEFITMLQLMGRVGAVFSPLQKARLVAACYPHFPDVVQVLRVLATGQVADGREQVSRWLS